MRDQIWPCRKIGQEQPRVIIWANLVVLEHPMMRSKIQGHWPFGSGEEDFFRFLPYMGIAAILVMWPGPDRVATGQGKVREVLIFLQRQGKSQGILQIGQGIFKY